VGKPYAETFRTKMVEKMLGPSGVSAATLARQTGVHQATLSRWLLDARNVPDMTKHRENKSTKEWTTEEKLRALIESSKLGEEELGAFLRRVGIHKAQLEEWRAAAAAALGKDPRRGGGPDARRVKELERELAKKDKALAEVTALLVLKKKLQALWGDEDDGTDEGSGK
jgi:transposase